MSLEQWEANAWIMKVTPSTPVIFNLISVARREISDASLEGMSTDGRFDHAYDAIRVLSELVLHAHGYAVCKGTHQHQRVIDSLEFTLGGDFAGEVAFFDQARRLRHQSMYERTGVVQQKDADDLLDAAKRLYAKIQQWLPERLPKQEANR